MDPLEIESPGWATWQLLAVELEGDTIHVDAVELPDSALGHVALLTLTFDRDLVGADHATLVAMLRRWSDGIGLCQVFRTGQPEGALALFHGAESLVVTGTSV